MPERVLDDYFADMEPALSDAPPILAVRALDEVERHLAALGEADGRISEVWGGDEALLAIAAEFAGTNAGDDLQSMIGSAVWLTDLDGAVGIDGALAALELGDAAMACAATWQPARLSTSRGEFVAAVRDRVSPPAPRLPQY